MKCNPSRWLWGVLPVAVWAWITVLGEHDRIEADLRQRTAEALSGTGLTWAATGFAGRDGTLTGRALNDSDPVKAAEIAGKVWGVRALDNRAELVEKVDAYMWSAAFSNGRLQLGGYVPSEESRKAVLAAIASTFPKVPVTDDMKLARGAPGKDVWLSGIAFGLQQLAGLKRGSVALNGTALSVAGEAADFPAYKGIKKALQKLPQGVKLVSEKVTPPVVDPFTWSAKLAANQLALSGYVPSEKLREEIFSQVKKSFPKVAIVDRMEIADGAPEGWANLAVSTLAGLAQLQDGEATISARDVGLSGTAANEGIATSARALFRKDAPKAFKLTDNIRYEAPAPVAAPPPPAPAPVAAPAPPPPPPAPVVTPPATDAMRWAEAEAKMKAEAQRIAEEAASKRKAAAAAAEAEAGKRNVEAQRCQALLRTAAAEGSIQFERANADLARSSLPTLKELARIANSCPGFLITVDGHTDAEGTDERNQNLSNRRAGAVAKYLIDSGVTADRVKATGYGATQPVAPNDTPQNRAKNRRIEFGVKAN